MQAPRGLRRVRRTLVHAAREDGAWLWSHRWLERTCRPLLAQATADLPEDQELALAAAALTGVDELPWTERLEPVQSALAHLEASLSALEERQPETLPSVELLVLPEEPRQERVPPAEPPKPKPRHALGAPGASGRPLSVLDGATPGLVEALGEASVFTIADLMSLVPEDHEVLDLVEVDAAWPEDGETLAVCGTIVARWTRFGPTGRAEELDLALGERVVRCRWHGHAPPDLPESGELTLVGLAELVEDRPLLYEAMVWCQDARGRVRRPLYAVEGVDDGDIWRLARRALALHGDDLLDPIPRAVLQAARIPGIEQALAETHVPRSSPSRARQRWAFEELLYYQIAAASKQEVRLRGLPHPLNHEVVGRLQQQHGIVLNDQQELVFDEIRRDLRKPWAMTRLLQGDVGSGKSVVAMLTALTVAESKAQVCFLAPDRISAVHRYLYAEPVLRSLGLVPQLLLEAPSDARIDALRRGESNCVFATHELVDHFPEFKKLGLVILEERSSFGQLDRSALAQKGVHPDLLVVTAVPIPTGLTFTLFSDHDISVLADPDRQLVQARVRQPEQRAEAYAELRARLDAGRQAYIAFPVLNGQDDLLPVQRARQLVAALGAEAVPGRRVALYHGGMTRDEQFRVFSDFQHRRIDVLVATTLIEDLPEVANATVMHVEHADRYDLVRLHRLRGHVARGREPGLCNFVLSQDPDEDGLKLVELLSREQDGFAVAEQDRIARGDQALLGEREDELPDFRSADTSRDRKILLRARRAALGVLKADPELRQRVHRLIAKQVRERHPEMMGESGKEARRSRSRSRRRRRRGGTSGAPGGGTG